MADCYVQKQAGGVMIPADDETAQYLTSIKTDSHLRVKITKVRNYQFHKKMFAFFNFCFAHWSGEVGFEFMDEKAQFDVFRKQLLILAGYRKSIVNLQQISRVFLMKTPVVSHHSETCHKCKNPIMPSAPRVILDRKTFKCNTCYLTEKYGDTLPKYRSV